MHRAFLDDDTRNTSLKDDKNKETRTWIRDTRGAPFIDGMFKGDSDQNIPNGIPDKGLARDRKIEVYFVSSDDMDRLIQLRADDHLEDDDKKHPFRRILNGCCFV